MCECHARHVVAVGVMVLFVGAVYHVLPDNTSPSAASCLSAPTLQLSATHTSAEDC